MEAKSNAKYIRIPLKKAKLILDQIRGKHVEEALLYLKFCEKKGAGFVKKALESALANAQNQNEGSVDLEKLKVVKASANLGPSFKRIQPRAMGRAYFVRHKSSHISIVLADK